MLSWILKLNNYISHFFIRPPPSNDYFTVIIHHFKEVLLWTII